MDDRPKVLLIEDDPVFLKIVGVSLDKRGYTVVSVTSFEQGLEALEDNVFSFVMTDIFMPGMGGIEGIKKLKAQYADLPIIAISGGWADLGPDETIEAAKKIGADAGVKKPISPADFDQSIEEIRRGNPFLSAE